MEAGGFVRSDWRLSFRFMSYHPYDNDDPRQRYAPPPPPAYGPPQPPPPPPSYGPSYGPETRERHGNVATIVARTVAIFTGAVAFIFVLHIFFSLTGANQSNGFVQFVYGMAKVFVLGFGDVFTPDDAKIGLVLNYGVAALVYLVVGQLVARALRR